MATDLIPYLIASVIILWMVIALRQSILKAVNNGSQNIFSVFGPFKRLFFKKHRYEIMRYLSRNSYYSKLSQSQKDIFARRVADFIFVKKFIPRKDCKLTLEDKILISASAIQLTFGLDQYLLSNFSKIYVYPQKYKSTIDGHFHRGEVNVRGAIVLSLEDFYSGLIEGDGINLGLHEMAHALKFDKVVSRETDKLFVFWFERWKKNAKRDFQGLEAGSLFRDYAKSNFNEFFAVCIENFFERPQKMKAEFPELYNGLKILLNQDPEEQNPIIRNQREIVFKDIPENPVPNKKVFKLIPSSLNTFVIFLYFIPIALIIGNSIYYGNVFWIILMPFFIVFSIPVFKIRKVVFYENCIVIKSLIIPFYKISIDYRRIEYVCFINVRKIDPIRARMIEDQDSLGKVFVVSYLSYGSIKSKYVSVGFFESEKKFLHEFFEKVNVDFRK